MMSSSLLIMCHVLKADFHLATESRPYYKLGSPSMCAVQLLHKATCFYFIRAIEKSLTTWTFFLVAGEWWRLQLSYNYN